jgi:hypothetical protein
MSGTDTKSTVRKADEFSNSVWLKLAVLKEKLMPETKFYNFELHTQLTRNWQIQSRSIIQTAWGFTTHVFGNVKVRNLFEHHMCKSNIEPHNEDQ